MKKVIVAMFLLTASPAFADYTMSITNNANGQEISSKVITDSQVQHLQKASSRTGKSVVNYFWEAVSDIIRSATADNKAAWQAANDSYIEEQSRQ